MEWIINQLRVHPELAIFLTLFAGFWLGRHLIDNAVKYSKEEAELSISCRQTGGTVTISVTDRGIGIPLDKQKHIFDKFYRVPTGNLHNIKGYGLGLFYVKSMVEKHGGTITVKSEPDKGSTFTITL